jgi:hypothetical protein
MIGRREEGGGTREEGGGRREEGRGKREEGRGTPPNVCTKPQSGRSDIKRSVARRQRETSSTTIRLPQQVESEQVGALRGREDGRRSAAVGAAID